MSPQVKSSTLSAESNRKQCSTTIAYNRVPDCFVDGHSGSNSYDLERLGISSPTAEGGRRDQQNLVNALATVFDTADAEIIDLGVNQHLGDGPFIQDGLLTLTDLHNGDNVVIELRPGDPKRFQEVSELLEAMRKRVDRVIEWDGEGCFEGGDALLPLLQSDGTAILPLGIRKTVPGDASKYSIRSTLAGATSLAKLVKPLGYTGTPFEFREGLHATSRMSGNLTNSGKATVVADPRSLTKQGEQDLRSMGFDVLRWPEQHLKTAWFGVNALYIAGKRICSDIPQVVDFYLENGMSIDTTFAPMEHMAAMQGSATCLLQDTQDPLPCQA